MRKSPAPSIPRSGPAHFSHARGVSHVVGMAAMMALAVACSTPAPGDGNVDPGNSGRGGRTAGTGGASSGPAAGGSQGMGNASGSSVGSGGATGTGGSGGASSSGGTGGQGGDGTSTDAGAQDASDPSAGGDANAGDVADPPAAACGLAGQICCAANTCKAGATAAVGEAGGTVVLDLKASGGDPYAYFKAKDLLPIDGPASGYITDTGMSFLFVLHQDGAFETVSSGARRQRNELTVNPGQPPIYKALKGNTISYTWRFRLDKMNANPTWCDIFQIKQHGPLGVAPYMALEADKSNLNVDTARLGVVKSVPLSQIMGVWINATWIGTFADAGSLAITLKKDDGTVVLDYKNDKIDMWDADVDFVRPKWGLYRNAAPGAGEAAIHYNDMRIIRGTPGGGCTCK